MAVFQAAIFGCFELKTCSGLKCGEIVSKLCDACIIPRCCWVNFKWEKVC